MIFTLCNNLGKMKNQNLDMYVRGCVGKGPLQLLKFSISALKEFFNGPEGSFIFDYDEMGFVDVF